MVLGVREPVEFARQVEEHPQLPAASCERVARLRGDGLAVRLGARARLAALDGLVCRRGVHVDLAPRSSGTLDFLRAAGVPAAVPAAEVAR